MYIPKDNDMLYSMVNMKLRDQYDSLEDFCECEDVDPARLIARLNGAGYEYDPSSTRFYLPTILILALLLNPSIIPNIPIIQSAPKTPTILL